MSSSDELKKATAAAVRLRARELRGAAATQNLFGFALCTDDDVRTLYHVACTREWVSETEKRNPGVGFIYVEWTLSEHDQVFAPISAHLATLATLKHESTVAWGAARDQRFQALVLALRDCRESGMFEADTLLCVASTDPSSHLEAMAMNAVDTLNTKAVADGFAKALGYEKHRKPA
jgi:hypothetical protein